MKALQLLHPVLHDKIVIITKKMQRKIDVLELKQPGVPAKQNAPVEEVDERVKTLERVNKEMKK